MWGQWYDAYQLAVLQLNIVNIYWNDEASICKLKYILFSKKTIIMMKTFT